MFLLPFEHLLIQLARMARMDRFLSGPPLHRHFFVPWPNRSKWLPAKLKQALKAGIIYKIDASSASPAASSVSGSSENAATTEELEVYLCKGYRYGTKDMVALLDAVEPPLQDAQSGSHDGFSFSASDDNDSGCLKTGEGYTRLVFLIEKVPLDATIADKEDEERWSSPSQETQLDPQQQKQVSETSRLLHARNYPWLRFVDLVICSSAEFDGDGGRKSLEVVLGEGLTMLTCAVRDWYIDEESRPELVVKGVNLEQARLCIEFASPLAGRLYSPSRVRSDAAPCLLPARFRISSKSTRSSAA